MMKFILQRNYLIYCLLLASFAISSCKKSADRYDVLKSLSLKVNVDYPNCKYHVDQINIVNGYAVQDSFSLKKIGTFSWYTYKDTVPTIISNPKTATCVVASSLQMLILGRMNLRDNFLFGKKIKSNLNDTDIAILFAEFSQMAYKIYNGVYQNGIGMPEMATMVNGSKGYKGIATDWTSASTTMNPDTLLRYNKMVDLSVIPNFITSSIDSGMVVSFGIHIKGTYDPLDAETLNRDYYLNKQAVIGHQITVVNYGLKDNRTVLVYEDSLSPGEQRCGYLDDLVHSSLLLMPAGYVQMGFLRMKIR